MSGLPAFGTADTWQDREPLPTGRAGVLERKDGGMLPVYFCLRCEERSAVEGRPETPDLLTHYDREETIHVCYKCGYHRAIEPTVTQ